MDTSCYGGYELLSFIFYGDYPRDINVRCFSASVPGISEKLEEFSERLLLLSAIATARNFLYFGI